MSSESTQFKDRQVEDRPWIQVAETVGSAQTAMVLKYLHANDIHAIAHESAAIALLTGANAVAHVMVPEAEVAEAMTLLAPQEEPEEAVVWPDEEADDDDDLPDLEKAILGATAVIFNPVGAGIAYVLAGVGRGLAEDVAFGQADCPICGTALELDEDEVIHRWFLCPECQETVTLDDFVVCPACRCEVELDEAELAQGWYICPDCHRAVRIREFD